MRTFKAVQDKALVLLVISDVIVKPQVVLVAHGKPACTYTLHHTHTCKLLHLLPLDPVISVIMLSV